jgi:hypothetical protein
MKNNLSIFQLRNLTNLTFRNHASNELSIILINEKSFRTNFQERLKHLSKTFRYKSRINAENKMSKNNERIIWSKK